MSDDRKAIRELLNSAVAACTERRDDQALALLHEAIANTKMTYGEENAGAVLISIMAEMNEDLQTKFLNLWSLFEHDKKC
jgi:hypothetical protein